MKEYNVLEVENLKTYFYHDVGVVKAVDDVSFHIKKGETMGIVGESGCGKTMTAMSIMRLLPGDGKIVDGNILLNTGDEDDKVQNLVDYHPDSDIMSYIRGGEIGMIFQEPMTALSPVHTVGNQIMESLLIHEDVNENEARDRSIDLLDRVGIPRPEIIVDNYSHQLSGGMKQRVMIAIALSCNPVLLIADEPTTAVDVTIQAQVLKLLTDIQQDFGMSIMFITHDLGVIAELSDRITVMYLGKVMESGNPEEIFFNPLHPYTQGLLKSIPGIGQKVKTRLSTIKGSIPSPYSINPGCPFYERCDHRKEGICNEEGTTIPTHWEDEHKVNCFLYE